MSFFIKIIPLFILLLLPGLVLAQGDFQLEVELPQEMGIGLSATSTLPETIRQVSNIALIVCLFAVFFILIYGGSQYITAAGEPAKLAKAKKKIIGAGLGLAVLACAFLLLQIINPQFLIMRIVKVRISSGVLLLNDQAYRVLSNPNLGNETQLKNNFFHHNPETRQEAMDQLLKGEVSDAKAVYMGTRIGNLESEFGGWLVGDRKSYLEGEPRKNFNPAWVDVLDNNEKKFNFIDFKLYGFVFLPGTIGTLSEFYCSNFTNVYCMIEGGISKAIQGLRSDFNIPDNIYLSEDCTNNPCSFKLLEAQSAFKEAESKSFLSFLTIFPSAPVSLLVEYTGTGVYLHGDKFYEVLPILQYYSKLSNLKFYDKFDDKTKKVEIRNWLVKDAETKEKLSNYLLVLHEDAGFQGYMRLFFEKFSLNKLDNKNINKILEKNPFTGSLGNVGIQTCYDSGVYCEKEINDEKDNLGRVKKPSSVQVFQMPVDKNDWEIWALRGCRVTICKEPVSGKTQSHFDQLKDEDCYVYNINPESLVGLTQPSNVQGPSVLPDDIPFMRTRNLPTGFDKNVVSMRIDGPCMVALFGDKLKTGNNDWEDKGDDRVKNEIFGPGDGEYPVYMNLLAKEGDTGYRNHHLIGTCESGKLGFGSKTRSCASAIAIFPLK